MSSKYHLKKRIFLNNDKDMCAYIIAIVEDTSSISNIDESSWKWGEITLKLSDCFRQISYDFNMCSKDDRKESLKKVRKIANTINAFKDALEQEAKSIKNREATWKKAKSAKA